MRLTVLFTLLAILGLGFVASTAQAISVIERSAYFEDAAGGVDTVPGTSGNGWTNPWQVDHSGSGTQTMNLDSSAPLYANSNNYLAYTVTDYDNNGYSCNLNRRYGSFGFSNDYTISFSLRFDDLSIWTTVDETNGNGSDRFYLSNTSDDDYSHQATRTGWSIRVQGDNPAAPIATALQFRFLAGSWEGNVGSTTSEYSGFTAQEDHLYEFVINVHNSNYTYEATVRDVTAGLSYTTSTPLNMEAPVAASYLSIITEQRNQGGNTFGYSIDNVEISQQITLGNMPTVVARFDGGNATDVVDAYTGMAGNGWGTAWKATTFSGTCTSSAACASLAELHPGDGNYLSVALTNNDASVASYGVSRTYRAAEGLNFTKDHTIEFSIRMDEGGIGGYFSAFTTEGDKYVITGSNAACGQITALDTFGIVAQGVDGTLGTGTAGTWVFADGDGAGSVASYVGSNLSLVEYGVYDFTITMNVDSQTYDVTVTDGTTEVTKEGLHWITASDMIGGFLNFATSADGLFETRAFSLDDIVITDIGGVVSIPGDTNNDNKVNADDAQTLALHWGQTVSQGDVTVGDFNNDGIVNAADASILAANWTGDNEGAAVPEPGTLLLLAMGGLILAARRSWR